MGQTEARYSYSLRNELELTANRKAFTTSSQSQYPARLQMRRDGRHFLSSTQSAEIHPASFAT